MVQTKAEFLRVAVGLVLFDGALDVLPHELVFQFQRCHGNAVEGEHHIDGVAVGGGVGKLPCTAEHVHLIQFVLLLVERRFGLEITDFELNAHVLDAVFENVNESVFVDGIFEAAVQLFGSVTAVILLVARPCLRLRSGDKVDQHFGIECLFLIVNVFMYPVTVRVEVRKLLISARIADQKTFNVAFKPFFTGVH